MGTRLSGKQLWLVRLAWVALVAVVLGWFLVLLWVYITQLRTICITGSCAVGQLIPATERALQAAGLHLDYYVISTVALIIFSVLICLGLAIIIFWHKSDDWMALLVSFLLIVMSTAYVAYALQIQRSPWQIPALALNILAFTTLFFVFSLFPDGKFAPRNVLWLPLIWFVWGIVIIFFQHISIFSVLHIIFWLGELLLLALAQIYRYFYISRPEQRQQTKWVVFGFLASFIIIFWTTIPRLIFPSLDHSGSLFQLLHAPAYTLALLIGSISIGIAVMRFRLYDIDIIINRTLVYGLLTALLTLIYVGSVVALQRLLQVMALQAPSPVVVAISTLIIALLFQMLRNRVQVIIDRRFYRRKYDAARTLTLFSTTLHNEIDLSELSKKLVAVVEETMQPTHVALWLPPPERYLLKYGHKLDLPPELLELATQELRLLQKNGESLHIPGTTS